MILTLTLLACVAHAPDGAVVGGNRLYGSRPDTAIPLSDFHAVALDGSPRDSSSLLGHPTVVWFYPAAGTYG